VPEEESKKEEPKKEESKKPKGQKKVFCATKSEPVAGMMVDNINCEERCKGASRNMSVIRTRTEGRLEDHVLWPA